MMSLPANTCFVKARIDVLNLVKENVLDSPSLELNEKVKNSTEILIQHIRNDLKHISSTRIIHAMIYDEFKENTAAYRTAQELYVFDKELLMDVLNTVFRATATDTNPSKVINALQNFKDSGLKVDAFCELNKYIDMENMLYFENAVKQYSKVSRNLRPEEQKKLQDLVKNIDEKNLEYLRYQTVCSQFEDFGDF